MTDPLIHIATITQPHGLKGQFKLHSLLEEPKNFSNFSVFYDCQGKQLPLSLVSVKGKQPIAKMEGVHDRSQVEPIRQTKIYVKAEEFPETNEGEFYSYQLVGLSVQNASGHKIGEVLAHHNFGAGDILDIAFTDGETSMFPFTDEVFPEIDMEMGTITILKPNYI